MSGHYHRNYPTCLYCFRATHDGIFTCIGVSWLSRGFSNLINTTNNVLRSQDDSPKDNCILITSLYD